MYCAECGHVVRNFKKNAEGYMICMECFDKIPKSEHQVYNVKAFLLPDSINSMASYHAKIDKEGIYKFSIHDCNGGIRLKGDLNDRTDIAEAIDKLNTLENALRLFRDHIKDNYTVTPFP